MGEEYLDEGLFSVARHSHPALFADEKRLPFDLERGGAYCLDSGVSFGFIGSFLRALHRGGGTMTIFDQIIEAQELLGKNRENTPSPKEKELLLLAIDALWFIWRNGQSYEFEGYRKDVKSNAPEGVVASFNTRDEAEAWLTAQPEPPDLACVLIADEYHVVLSSRDRSRRSLVPDPELEYHIEGMMRDGLPQAVAAFNIRDEANAWFNRQTELPAQTVIQIGGEHYLAVFYRNINHRTLFPFSIVERLHARRKRREQKGSGE